MSKKIKIASKGYTLKVTSWENDADNYNTLSKTYKDKDYAKGIAKMVSELFSNESEGGIGNMDESPSSKILDYLSTNKVLENQETLDNEEKVGLVMDINYELMGGSEYYTSRVFESMEFYYLPKSIYADKIEITNE